MADPKRVVKIHCPNCGQKMDVSDVNPFARIQCPMCDAEVIVPQVFAGITLEEPIAEDEGLTVYRALDPTLDREVAVKALGPDDDRGERFLAEARRAAAITHANVAPIYSCGVEDGRAYLVMQFLAGGSLARWLERSAPGGNPRFALKCGLALARALSAGRRQQLEHGHLVPANVLLDVEGNVKLSDFGLATSLRADRAWRPAEYAYAAPEVLAGAATNWRADMFSVGAITHHLLTGRAPAVGTSPEEIRENRLSGQLPPDPVRLISGLPPGLSDLIMSLQAFRPEDRPSGYEEVVGAFRAFEQRVARDTAHQTRAITPVSEPTEPKGEPLVLKSPERDIPKPDYLVPTAPKTRAQFLVDVGLVVAAIALTVLVCLYIWRKDGATDPGKPAPVPSATRAPSPPTDPTASPTAASDQPAPVANPESPPPAQPAAASRELPAVPTERRPQPAGLDFPGQQAALDQYLASLPGPARALEAERLGVVRDIKRQLVKDMEYLPYKDLDVGIELTDGRHLKGSLPLVSDTRLMVRTDGGQVALAWQDLPFPQFVRFLQYYLDRRLNQADEDMASDLLARQKLALGELCLRNAVLCEWYSRPELGREFARLCGQYAPSLAEQLRRLAPGTVAGK
jgi:serine/threonine-protein kinase